MGAAPSVPSVWAPPCSLMRPGDAEHQEVLVHRRVGCCAAPEVRTRCLCKRCSVHVFPHLTREGLMPAREERVLGFPHRLGAVGMDALPSCHQHPSPREEVFGTRDFNSMWLKSSWNSALAALIPTIQPELSWPWLHFRGG